MKSVIIFLLLVVGFINADFPEKRGVLRRFTRHTVKDLTNNFLQETPSSIVQNCKFNGLDKEEASELTKLYKEVLVCMRNVTILISPKQDYLDRIDTCMVDPIKKSKECLKPDQHYFLDFFIERTKSLVDFFYANLDLMKSIEVADCLKYLSTYRTQIDLYDCLVDVMEKTHDDEYIPPSRAEFCKRYLPAVDCFPNSLKGYCLATTKINRFFAGYLEAMKAPCNVTEVVTDIPKLE